MKLYELFNITSLQNRQTLKRLRRHEHEIEKEETQADILQGENRPSDLMTISSLYNTGAPEDAALADDLLDLAHSKTKAKKASRIQAKAQQARRQKIKCQGQPRNRAHTKSGKPSPAPSVEVNNQTDNSGGAPNDRPVHSCSGSAPFFL